LGRCRSINELQKALASLPKTLDDTYARILLSIEEDDIQNALKILQWLVYSTQPLQIDEIAEVITVNVEANPRINPAKRFEEPQDILTIFSSLITIAEPMEGPRGKITRGQVRLAHFSVKEYLVSERIQAGSVGRYSIREIHAHTSIAKICLAYLLQFDNPNSLALQTVK
jgi:hypothetical protein